MQPLHLPKLSRLLRGQLIEIFIVWNSYCRSPTLTAYLQNFHWHLPISNYWKLNLTISCFRQQQEVCILTFKSFHSSQLFVLFEKIKFWSYVVRVGQQRYIWQIKWLLLICVVQCIIFTNTNANELLKFVSWTFSPFEWHPMNDPMPSNVYSLEEAGFREMFV